MSFNLCGTFNLSLKELSCFCCIKKKKKEHLHLGKTIHLIESNQVLFDSLIPLHDDYLLLKILRDETVISAEGGFMEDLEMSREDFIGIKVSHISKNVELFRSYITTVFKRVIETSTVYQFCFKLNEEGRIFCCTIYPCPIPDFMGSIDCVIRPGLISLDPRNIDRFAVKND